ncbi:TldD/PmbA family protein [Micromonospora endophytica]|uniref:Peptidase U62 n=1 Tax=Micromonospora endophytica TaxID=515350 RepID=A0A2W2DMS9_9ACTN|nr:metallopeptidase TldD-related protein [Micromonospora endophytica]PZF94103.1 peptidase U62 [Micromonospora endophytica]RIW44628.1 TldD/PmbA family protein [Micromonospora endophytica]BCJ60367.1 peptidase U62 [Micromonospora endophytica]
MTVERDVASQVVELVARLAGPGPQAEVLVTRAELALTRFANSAIHQNVAETQVEVRLRVHVAGRTAAGSANVTTADGLRALVERVLAAARVGPLDPAWPGLTPATPMADSPQWDTATGYAGPDDRATLVRAFVDAAGGLTTAGYCRTALRATGFANSAGHAVQGYAAEAAMDGIARAGGADGVARQCVDRLADLDGAELGRRAAAKARAAADPVELAPGRYPVVLEPAAVADLLHNLAWYGFNGKRYAERQSFVEPGVAQFDRAVTLVDDPLAGIGLPFDLEGTPARALTLVDAGTTTAVVHDRRSAAEWGVESTGHAWIDSATAGPMPRNLRLVSSGTAGRAPATGGPARGPVAGGVDPLAGAVTDADTAALVSRMERGLLVSDLWYTRVLEPKSLVITGLTRNGVWLVEQGQVTRAVRDLRFTESYPRALGPGAVREVGRRAFRQPDRHDGAWWEAPSLRLAAWNFTGGASG